MQIKRERHCHHRNVPPVAVWDGGGIIEGLDVVVSTTLDVVAGGNEAGKVVQETVGVAVEDGVLDDAAVARE